MYTQFGGRGAYARAAASYKPPADGPDLGLISDLLETIERTPYAVEPRVILVQQYRHAGWMEEADNIIKEIRKLNPEEADKISTTGSTSTTGDPVAISIATPPESLKIPEPISKSTNLTTRKHQQLLSVVEAQGQLFQDCKILREKAAALSHQVRMLDMNGIPTNKRETWDTVLHGLHCLSEGNFTAVIPADERPMSVRALARVISQALFSDRVDLIVEDLKRTARWLETQEEHDDSSVQPAIEKRINLLRAALPLDMEDITSTAMMHIAHEKLGRKYINDETMYGDPVSDIPRSQFLATEDGYAWDMEELPKALSVNGAVMRNPLSKDLFSDADVRAILQHPLGQHLAAEAVAQSQLVYGVREATITRLRELGEIILKDNAMDQAVSRTAIDQFKAYVATLPSDEQNNLEMLRCPATDSHTRQPFDFSVLEALRDAVGNRTCFHKVGDYLKQAARHLQSQQAAAAEERE